MRLQSTGRPVQAVPVGESWGDRERGGQGKPGSAEERAHVLCMACCGIGQQSVGGAYIWWRRGPTIHWLEHLPARVLHALRWLQ